MSKTSEYFKPGHLYIVGEKRLKEDFFFKVERIEDTELDLVYVDAHWLHPQYKGDRQGIFLGTYYDSKSNREFIQPVSNKVSKLAQKHAFITVLDGEYNND